MTVYLIAPIGQPTPDLAAYRQFFLTARDAHHRMRQYGLAARSWSVYAAEVELGRMHEFPRKETT